MNFAYSEEQNLLGDSAGRFVRERYRFEESQATILDGGAVDKRVWRHFRDQGWLGLPISEESGGLGGSATDVGILMAAFGQGPVLEPYLPVVVLAANLIGAVGTNDQKASLLPRIAEGESIVVFAHHEAGSGHSIQHVAAQARRDGDGWVLGGTKLAVLGGYAADQLIVSARISGAPRDQHGIGLFLVSIDAKGLTRTSYPTVDGGCGSDFQFEAVKVSNAALLGNSDNAFPIVERACDFATAALAAQIAGSAQVLVDMTIDYTRSRVQFGKPLTDNQVIRHRLVDMSIASLEARAAALHAAGAMEDDAVSRARAVSSAKWKVATGARFIAEQAVQLHGAIGCTDEYALGRYYKSILAFELQFGTTDWHLRRHADLRATAIGRELKMSDAG